VRDAGTAVVNGRVAELAVRYRVPRAATVAAAQVPLLERVMRMGLAEEVAAQIAAIDDPGDEVVVLREAVAGVTLRPSDWSLDRAMLARVGRAAREAVVARLARPAGEDDMMRFPSEAAFAGSFIVELLNGTAWDRWYFGAFRRFRLAGARETLERLLADAELDRGAVFAWLEARGRLAAVLQLVGPGWAGAAAAPWDRPGSPPPAELSPLAVAGFAIVEALGVPIECEREAALLREYYAVHPDRPAWDDRAALTAWVWAFARWVLSRRPDAGAALRPGEAEAQALHELLTHRLDWLDGEWLERRVSAEWPTGTGHGTPSARASSVPALRPRHATLLAGVAALIRRGVIHVDRLTESPDQIITRMIAALEAAGETDGPRDRAFVTVLEQARDAWLGGSEARQPPSTEPALRELVEALASSARAAAGGIETSGAGLYLLTRAVTDVNLVALAERAGVPRVALLGALACKLLGLRPPFDPPVAAWVGAEDPRLAALEVEALWLLEGLLLERLVGQRHLERGVPAVHEFAWREQPFVALVDARGTCWPLAQTGEDDARARLLAEWGEDTASAGGTAFPSRSPLEDLRQLAPLDDVPPAVEVAVTSVASGVFRAWSRWLPGVSGSSMPFLVRNCLARGGCVRLDGGFALVSLDPAPLDAVLELAGYLKPMESARWLGRHVRFSIARSRR
jgi:hypothetical protein